MAHELDFDKVTGIANMFSRNTPWHNEGIRITVPPKTTEEALRIIHADYEVKVFPLQAVIPMGENKIISIDSPTGKAIIRMDRIPSQDSILGVVGDGYTPLQNTEAFEIFDPLLEAGLIELETGGILRKGADAWLMGKLIIKDAFIEDVFQDKTKTYILASNNHTGKTPVTVMFTPIEVVCANTLGMAHHGKNKSNSMVVKKHTKTVRMRYLEEAMKFFERMVKNYHLIAEDFKFLKERILTVEEFEKHVLDNIAPFPPEDAEKTSHFDSVIARINIKRDRISQFWENGTGLTGNHSAWEAYNAVAELVDYDEDIFKTRKSSSRIQSLISGPLGEIKQRVLDDLVVLARN